MYNTFWKNRHIQKHCLVTKVLIMAISPCGEILITLSQKSIFKVAHLETNDGITSCLHFIPLKLPTNMDLSRRLATVIYFTETSLQRWKNSKILVIKEQTCSKFWHLRQNLISNLIIRLCIAIKLILQENQSQYVIF